MTIGTPPQSFRLQLDTGSSDVVIVNSDNSVCGQQGGCPSGSYTPKDSSTYSLVSEGTFNNTYGDGTSYVGDYITDVVDVGKIDIKAGDLIIGLANELGDGPQLQNDGSGLVGVGYQANSGAIILTYQENGTLPPTVVSAMVASGDIGRQAYSLFLGQENSASGSIIFGGVDPSYYSGDLVAVPVLKDPIQGSNIEYTSFTVALTGVSISDDSGTRSLTDDNFAVPVLLDSGTTITHLTSDLAQAINDGFGATQIQGNGVLPCSRASSNASITYHFGGSDGPAISVPLDALMWDFQHSGGQQFSDGQDACLLAVEGPIGDNPVILGDSFMRSGYFVFDLENNQVAMAQAVTSSPSGGSVTAIESGTDIPGCSSTNTFSIDAATVTQGGSSPQDTEGSDVTSLGNPATPTFDLGAAGTQTSNLASDASGSSGGSSGSASSSGSGNAAGQVVIPSMTLVVSSGVMAVAVGFAMVLL